MTGNNVRTIATVLEAKDVTLGQQAVGGGVIETPFPSNRGVQRGAASDKRRLFAIGVYSGDQTAVPLIDSLQTVRGGGRVVLAVFVVSGITLHTKRRRFWGKKSLYISSVNIYVLNTGKCLFIGRGFQRNIV